LLLPPRRLRPPLVPPLLRLRLPLPLLSLELPLRRPPRPPALLPPELFRPPERRAAKLIVLFGGAPRSG
ncbi:MAG TPA: hypothetical protein VFU38_10100, partial [Candidatus Krumholzibacteria bacterium]|nr:hypothetical protein [Candidatus Krumholzibacteria bacterium]